MNEVFKRFAQRVTVLGAVSVLCLATVLPVAPVFAQAPATDSTGAPKTTSNSYKIVAEDVLDISVVDHPDVNRNLPVSIDGTIDYPYVGQINVVGMTLGDLKKRIAKDLSKQFVRPQVLITVTSRRTRTFSTYGALKAAGKHPLKEGERLLEALADVGGLPADRAEFYTAKILRKGQEIPVDLVKLLNNDPAQNILLQEDDILYVQEKEQAQTSVQVIGQVLKPGPQVWPRDGSLITVLQNAGGPTPLARLSQVTIERDGKLLPPIDMRTYQKNGFEPAVKLKPGDKLIVPENKMEYTIWGPVPRSGVQVYPDDRKLTVYEALALAGGTLQGTEYKKTKLTRPLLDANGQSVKDEKGGVKQQVFYVNVEKMWKTGDRSEDILVQPGDTITVPPAGGRRGLDFWQVVGASTGLLGLLNFFSR